MPTRKIHLSSRIVALTTTPKIAISLKIHQDIQNKQDFPNSVRLVGGGEQFGQNGQKLHENYENGILGSKQWKGDMRQEEKAIFG